jgi:hypothetical protein
MQAGRAPLGRLPKFLARSGPPGLLDLADSGQRPAAAHRR